MYRSANLLKKPYDYFLSCFSGLINLNVWRWNVDEHLGLPGFNKTLRINVFDKGLSRNSSNHFRNQTNRLQCMIIAYWVPDSVPGS